PQPGPRRGRHGSRRQPMAGVLVRHPAGARPRHPGRRPARAYRVFRRLRDHQHGGGGGFRNPSHGDLRHGPPRRQPRHQCDLRADHAGFRRVDSALREGARNMRRRYFTRGIAGLAACARARRPRLNVYNWSAYVAPETIPAFEAEFGVRVRYATYESNEEMLAKVIGGNSGWDVVFPTHNRLQPMRANGLLAPLRHEWLRNLPHLDPRFRAPAWDAGLQWGVPYMWNGTGIVYNRALHPPPARSWPAPNGRLSRRNHCSAPTSMPKCVTNWWPGTCWPRNSGAPPRSRPSMPRHSSLSSIRPRAFPSTAIAPSFCARAAAAAWRINSWTTCCAPPCPPKSWSPPGPPPPMRARWLFCPRACAPRRASIPRATPSTVASGRARSTPPPRGCGIAYGRRSSRHSGAPPLPAAQLTLQPCFGELPVAPDRSWRRLQYFRRFFFAHSAEIAQLH